MNTTSIAFINHHSGKLHMKVLHEDSKGFIKKTVSLKLNPDEYEHIIPMDYLLGDRNLSDCEELWELFADYEEEHLIEEF